MLKSCFTLGTVSENIISLLKYNKFVKILLYTIAWLGTVSEYIISLLKCSFTLY